MRHALFTLAALFPLTSAHAGETYDYDCNVERPAALGSLQASSQVSKKGERRYVSLSWSLSRDLSPLSLGTSWFNWHGEQPALSSVSYFYGRRGQRIRFHFANGAGEVLLRSEPLRRNRSRFFHYSLPWDSLRSVARRAGVLHVTAVAEGGSVLDEQSISYEQLEEVDRQAEQLSREFAAILSNYRVECDTTGDDIILVH